MVITQIDKPTIELLQKAIQIVLEQNHIPYRNIGVAEEENQLLFLYEGKDHKVHVFKWSKASSIGVNIGTLAQSVITPILPHLRLLS
ncbi:hypothetical protein [Neobacillus dielmonensis]|uniref:hypothetical protein n=1 Tax=Neobacillus dielmonensis TaxID=1347369 RepID=UPI0005A89F92|nr:hypothetical protein [Neobacillus dielmonensis]